MSVDASAPQVVTENDNQAQIAQAIAHNAQMVQQMTIAETTAFNEQKSLQATPTGGEGASEILGRASSSGSSLSGAKGSTEASVYGDMAFDAAGFGGVAQAGKMLVDAIEDYKDPFKSKLGRTMDDVIKNGVSGNGKKDSIFTGPFNKTAALPARADGVNDFMKSPLKGVKTTESKIAEFSKKREMVCSAKMLSQCHLGNAKAAEAKVGAKVFKAEQLGFGSGSRQQLALNNYQPKGPTEMSDTAASTTTTDWA